MNFQIKSRAPVTLEPIAFADVVINLFVFFFLAFGLAASFDTPHKGTVPVQLPRGGHVAETSHKEPLALTVKRDGKIYFGARRLALSDLTEAVNGLMAEKKSKNVIIQADRHGQLNQLVPILDRLRQTNANAVSIETELN